MVTNLSQPKKKGAAPRNEAAPIVPPAVQRIHEMPAAQEKPLEGAAKTTSVREPEGLRMIELARIERSHTNRHEFDEEKMKEFTEDVRDKGVTQPLTVRPIKYVCRPYAGDNSTLCRVCGDSVKEGLLINIPADEVDDVVQEAYRTRPLWEIVMGERRSIAAKRAGLKEVPCLVKNLDDRQALEHQLTENLQREDLRPLDEARGYRQMQELGYSVDEMAAKLNKGRSAIYARLGLLDLPDEAKTAVEQGTLPSSQAEMLLAIDDEAAQKRVAAAILKPKRDWEDGKEVQVPHTFREAKLIIDEAKRELKKEREWQEKTKDYRERAGYKVMTVKGSEKFMSYGSVRAGYVGAGDACPCDEKKRTWKQVLGVHAPTCFVVHGGSYSTSPLRILFDRKAAEKALGLAGIKVKVAESSQDRREREDRERKEEQAKKIAQANEKIGQLVAAVESREMPTEALRLLVSNLMREGPGDELLVRRGVITEETGYQEKKKALARLIEKSDARALRGLAMESILWEWRGAAEDNVNALAKIYGVNVRASGQPKPKRGKA